MLTVPPRNIIRSKILTGREHSRQALEHSHQPHQKSLQAEEQVLPNIPKRTPPGRNAPQFTARRGKDLLERETGVEPATSSLGN